MKLSSPFKDNVLPDTYAKGASVQVRGNAVISFPFMIEDVPKGTKTFAWTFVDYDSIPVCGFAYIHWVVANVPSDMTAISEDFSRLDAKHTHGKNSLVSKFLNEDNSEIFMMVIWDHIHRIKTMFIPLRSMLWIVNCHLKMVFT